MTVETTIFDGKRRETRIYRKVYKGVNLAELREGFYAQEQSAEWGLMVQLRGKDRIVIGRFGMKDEDE
jgi:hypothetical protein